MTNDEIPEWLELGFPSLLLREIASDPVLLNDASSTSQPDFCKLAEGLVRTIPADALRSALVLEIARSARRAFDFEARRLRKRMKGGFQIETEFPFILASEIAWNVHHADGGTATADETLSQLTGCAKAEMINILAIWKLPNGRVLGEATAGYLRKVAQDERAMADGHISNAVFYERLAGDLPDGANIAEHVKSHEAEAARIYAFGTGMARLAA